MTKIGKNSSVKLGVFAAGGAIIALVGIVSTAQGGTMGNGGQQRTMVQVRRCTAMSHDEMMKDQGCRSTLAQHPELFSPGTAKPPKTTP